MRKRRRWPRKIALKDLPPRTDVVGGSATVAYAPADRDPGVRSRQAGGPPRYIDGTVTHRRMDFLPIGAGAQWGSGMLTTRDVAQGSPKQASQITSDGSPPDTAAAQRRRDGRGNEAG